MILAEQVTMPEGMVKGPETVLPRNSVFKSFFYSVKVIGSGVQARARSPGIISTALTLGTDPRLIRPDFNPARLIS